VKDQSLSDMNAMMKEFDIDFMLTSLLVMNESKKIKKKNRSSESLKKQKRADIFTTRDSFDHEYVKTKMRERERERERVRAREREDEREREREDERAREREDERTRARAREREREREQISIDQHDINEMSSEMTSMLQF
jgi:hypothetical protein